MNKKMIGKLVGVLFFLEALFMLPAIAVCFVYGETGAPLRGFLWTVALLLALSGALFFVFLCMCFAGAPNFSLGLFAVFVLSVGLSETKGEIFSKQIVFEVYKKRLDRGVEKKTLVFSEEATLKSVAKRMSHHFVYRIEVVEAKDGEVKKVFSHAQFLNLLSSHALDTPLKELL